LAATATAVPAPAADETPATPAAPTTSAAPAASTAPVAPVAPVAPAAPAAPADYEPENNEPADLVSELVALEARLVEQDTALLTAMLDRLGAAHHRPFSRG